MMELFPETSHWMTFNEPGVYALQTHLRGVAPPGKVGDFQGAGLVLRNLMAAHCNIYREAKQRFGDRVQIGITHQWLKFVPLNGNPLERLICYVMSKITHYSVYNFFKTGRLDFEIAGRANIHLEVPQEEFEKQNRFLDFIAPQFYGLPRLQMGWSGGETYPGYQTRNFNLWKMGFSFGSSCHEGGKMQSFGPSFYPESLKECLADAEQLGHPISITETGCDAMIQKWGDPDFSIDEKTQESYFKSIAPILKEYKEKICAIFIWTLLRDRLEWDLGDAPSLGLISVKVDQNRNIEGYTMSPGARLIQKIFQAKSIFEVAV
jgi:beta-glucosidase